MSGPSLNMTKDHLDGFIREALGPVVAEQRRQSERMAELAGKASKGQSQPPWLEHMQPRGKSSDEGKPGLLLPRVIACAAAQKMAGTPDAALAFCEKMWGTGAELDPIMKTLQAGDLTGGGVSVDQRVAEDWIELLRAKTVMRMMGADTVQMPEGTYSQRKETGDVTAYYTGENVAVNASQPKNEWIHLVAKELNCLVPVSNKLIRYASGNVEQRVTRTCQLHMSRREDLAFLRGDGLQNTPRGVRNLLASGQALNVNATVNHTNVVLDIGKLMLAVEEKDVPMITPGFVFAPRTKQFLMDLLTADGQFAFRAEMTSGSFSGHPFGVTSQIPRNLGGGGDESELYYIDFEQVLIGDALNMTVATTNEGSYLDAQGNMQSTFANRETAVLVTSEHDIGLKYDVAGAYFSDVDWGA